ncbi:MAG: hypothetical protein CMI36_14920 [Owenweeksia sp.]|nr:hypothetical protein [Owenweeksia sp.]MBG00284.1 hypothetical protein [Owenweeksia sp.]HBF21700.1 hypothetical protein [Cryomorphaceae bacterium]|tara:strand:- start:1659 stop:2351 length:693 start_codon:yes stop_codon:yes gene_type:complete
MKSKATQRETTSKIDSAADRPKTLLEETEEDTILERNDPNSLDLSKHQIFIDTTRNSTFYESVKQWGESKWDKQSIKSSLNAINKDFKPKQIDLKNFPSHFITLRKFNDQFVLYDRCDGIDPRFEIRDTAFIFYGPLESDAESISNIISLTNNSIELELRTFQAKSNDQKSRLKIEKIDDFIYKMTYKNQTFDRVEYLTTVDGIEKFDLVVNNCPTMKMMEFDGFDEEGK